MEVFMYNIAHSVDHLDMMIMLSDKLHNPPFRIGTEERFNFDVQLFKKSKGSGILTLPTYDLGHLFLQTYGVSGIDFKGRRIKFKISTESIALARLQYIRTEPWHNPRVLQQERRRNGEASAPIQLKDFKFGRFSSDRSFLISPHDYGKASIACDMNERCIKLTLTDPPNTMDTIHTSLHHVLQQFLDLSISPEIWASYAPSQVREVIATDKIHRSPVVFLECNSPPIFQSAAPELLQGPTRKKRLSSLLPISATPTRLESPMCYSLCLTFASSRDSDQFIKRCRDLHILSVQFTRPIKTRPLLESTYHLGKFDELLQQLVFELAFEVDKAYVNAILEIAEILMLKEDLLKISSTWGAQSAEPFRHFSMIKSTRTHLFVARRRRKRGQNKQSKSVGQETVIPTLSEQLNHVVKEYFMERDKLQGPLLLSPTLYKSYSLITTPTSKFLEGPLPDQSNSVLRRFENHQSFLRVSIQDEHRSNLRRDQNLDLSEILSSRFRVFLTGGVRVAGRAYEFLGYSMSGLREHSVWFVSPFIDGSGTTMNAATIRKKLGDFSKLAYEPARLAARWSQAFSTTSPSVTLEKNEIMYIRDRTYRSRDGNESVFTDGCGTISPDLATAVWRRLRSHVRRYSRFQQVPSCFQFRLGGAKGVVIQDPTLAGKRICLRPSQIKFDAPDVLTLDIQATSSKPKLMFLNRPLVMLLDHLGVDRSSIIDLQSRAIEDIQSIQTSLPHASSVLMRHDLGASFRLPSLFNNIAEILGLQITDLSASDGLHCTLIEGVLYSTVTYALREIKYRTHIVVPGSFTLVGACDEWDCLTEGEIYATIQDERTGERKPILGRVLITRSPQIHPGDVQLVTAVDRPELHHLTNVVVFSSKGQRSLPSCLGGGDLDGDDYNLILDTNLHPLRTVTPGAYKSLPRARTLNPCTIEDVADFVINYIKNDLLGYISILHLRFADLKNAECAECLMLAEAASHAVDFPKTGTPVQFSSLPTPPSGPKPDFLAHEASDPSGERFYSSQKLLGVLFQNVPAPKAPPEIELGRSPLDGNTIKAALENKCLPNLGLRSLEDPSESLVEEMESLLSYYMERVISIAKAHSLFKHDSMLSEKELVSGTILRNWKDHRKRREAVTAMNLQSHELAKTIRDDLWRVERAEIQDFEESDDESDESDDEFEDLDIAQHREVFNRAFAAWTVAEWALEDEPEAFGPQSFGLIALGVMLEVIKDASHV